MIVDAHQHFWDPRRAAYPWMTDDVAAIHRPFGPADFEPELRANGVDGTIVVQARSSVEETRDLLELATRTPFVRGVVGWVDLTDPGITAVVAGLRAGTGGARLAGIRHQVHDEADPGWLDRDDVRRGIRAVGDAGLAYDLLVRPRELPAATRLVRDLPGVRFVVDHLAKPSIRGGQFEPWATDLARLAAAPNAWCKVSGLVTEADWHAWRPADLRPYVVHALGAFGPARLLFGSDWPVCLLAASYRDVLEAVRECLDGLDERELGAVLGANAIDVYRV